MVGINAFEFNGLVLVASPLTCPARLPNTLIRQCQNLELVPNFGHHWHAYMAFGGAFGEKDRIVRKPVPVRRCKVKEFAG